MKELYHICQWNADKRKSWSGTYYSIYKELGKLYDIKDISIETPFLSKVKRMLLRKYGIGKYEFSFTDIKKLSKKLTNGGVYDNKCAFQYAETPVVDGIHNYIYQDMCADFILNVILEKPEFSAHYIYSHVDRKKLKKRCEDQKVFYDKCAGIFTMGRWLSDYLTDKLGVDASKVHCVGAGVDIDTSMINPHNRENRRILFVGRNFEAKGGKIVVEAFEKLKKLIPNAELFIVGPEKNPLDNSIDGVFYKGVLSGQELLECYNICDIFCMPSYVDAYGKVFTEAICCGLPCIARNVLSMPEIIRNGENGYCIDSDDTDNLADVMYKLLIDNDMHKNVEDKREYYCDYYSWSAVAKRISAVIDKDAYMNGV